MENVSESNKLNSIEPKSNYLYYPIFESSILFYYTLHSD